MRLSDFLTDVGRPVAYYPGLRKITGSTNATIFLCQFVYWTGKESAGDGWIYKTSEEIESETGLSYKEQTTAREKLVTAGLIEEKYARLEHQMYFRVNLDTLNDKWGNAKPETPELTNGKMAKSPLGSSLNSNSETTTETTQYSDLKISGIESAIRQGRPVTQEDIDAGKKGFPYREKFAEPNRVLLDVFYECRPIPLLKKDIFDWLSTSNEWIEIGATAQDIKDAYQKSLPDPITGKGGFTVGRPGSLTTTLQAVVGERRKSDKPKSNKEFMDKYLLEHGNG